MDYNHDTAKKLDSWVLLYSVKSFLITWTSSFTQLSLLLNIKSCLTHLTSDMSSENLMNGVSQMQDSLTSVLNPT